MKHAVDPLQPRLFDPFEGLFGKLGLRRLLQGWQAVFRGMLLALMPVRQLGNHFHPVLGRPTKELYSIAGLLFLQETFDWTNEQTVEAYLFRTDVQFALNIEPGTEMCERTLERYRALFLEDDLAAGIMNDVSLKLVAELELEIDKQRLDSTHVFGDMASFGRTRMMAVTIKRFLTQVQRHQPDDFAALADDLRQRYAPSQAKLFASKGASAEQRNKTRQQVAEDMRDLLDRFADHAGLNTRPSYQAMATVFAQQCEIVADKIVLKTKTGGNCVQNPSDMDATYDGCKGQGYKVQLVETCSENNPVQLIVSALPQTAVESDAAALEPVLADLEAKDILPASMLADTAYGSDDNVQKAAALGVELVAPTPGAPPVSEPVPDAPGAAPVLERLTIDDFATDAQGRVEACPSGKIPLQVLTNQGVNQDKTTIEMHPEDCESCPFRAACPIEKTKKGQYKLEYTEKTRRHEERRREENTAAFRQRYAKRSGLESTNSGLKRKHGLGQLRVRGQAGVRHAIYLKVAGWNLCQAAASGKLVTKVAELLRKLGLSASRSARWLLFFVISRVCAPWPAARARSPMSRAFRPAQRES